MNPTSVSDTIVQEIAIKGSAERIFGRHLSSSEFSELIVPSHGRRDTSPTEAGIPNPRPEKESESAILHSDDHPS